MSSAERAKSQKLGVAWPPAVAAAGWLVPGAGYWMIGQRSRGVVVGVTIIALFVMGILIGGVRILEVPGFGPNGQPIHIVRAEFERNGESKMQELPMEDGHPPQFPGYRIVSTQLIAPVMLGEPFVEIREKPWSIAQIMAGPMAILAGAWSVEQSRPAETADGLLPAGSRSHARLNEIGILYTAVAGMLDLMVIIDAAYRAAYPELPAAETVIAKPEAGVAS